MIRHSIWLRPPAAPKIVDPFHTNWRKYHTCLFIIVGILFFQYGWLYNIDFDVPFHCADPLVADPCSPQCQSVAYKAGSVGLTNFNKRSGWICNKRWWQDMDVIQDISYIASFSLIPIFEYLTIRRMRSIISVMSLSTIIQPLFFINNGYSLMLWLFLEKMFLKFAEMETFIYLMESIPTNAFTFGSILLSASVPLGSYIFERILVRSGSWILVATIKIVMTVVTCIVFRLRLCKSHRYLFSKGKVEECIQVLERQAILYNEDPSKVRKMVEKAWRETRCRPHTTEAIGGLIRYPFVRRVTWSLLYMSVIKAILDKGVSIPLDFVYSKCFRLIGCCLYLATEKYFGHVQVVSATILICGINFLFKASFEDAASTLYATALQKVLFAIVGIVFYVIGAELYPQNIFPPLVTMDYFLFFISSKFAKYISSMRVTWVGNAIFAALVFLYFGEFETIPETKYLKKPQSIRETEIFIKKSMKKVL